MRAMSKRAALLATFAAVFAIALFAACSGEQVADAPQPTPSSTERVERSEPSAAEPQAEQVQEAEPAPEAAEEQAEAVQEVAGQEQEETAEEPSDAVEAEVESEQDETISLLPPNVLGDPAAEVHIIHFGDFQ